MLNEAEEITFLPLAEGHIPLLHNWLQRPHVIEWWGGEDAAPTLAATYQKYSPRLLHQSGVFCYIALLGSRPIGYAQSYVALGAGDGWWEEETDPGVRGIDQFLCDGRSLGQGLGTRMVSAFVRLLFSDLQVTRLQTDPAPNNLRAIRCYEKSGFKAVREIITPDGPALFMLQDRPNSRKVASAA